MQWELHPTPPPNLWHIKSTLHLWHFFLQRFDTHYIICTLYTVCFFSPSTQTTLANKGRHTSSLTTEQIQAVQLLWKIKSLNLHQSCRMDSTAAIPVTSWRQMQKLHQSCLLNQHPAAARETKRKDKVSQEPKNLSVALPFCYFQNFFIKVLSLIRNKGSPSGNYGPISEWPEPLLPPTGISKILLSVFASHFWSTSAATATRLYILLYYKLQSIFTGARPRQNYFSLWVLKLHELTRFTEAISRINRAYQWIFKEAPHKGYSTLKNTDFMQRMVWTA